MQSVEFACVCFKENVGRIFFLFLATNSKKTGLKSHFTIPSLQLTIILYFIYNLIHVNKINSLYGKNSALQRFITVCYYAITF